MAERQFNKQVKIVRSDNETKFTSLRPFFATKGILHQTSCVYTPQKNGRVERKHRHILNIARTLLFQAVLPTKFWGENVLTTAYLINHTPTSLLAGKTPYKILHSTPPSYENLCVFGSLCYAQRHSALKDKFQERNRKCIFVGYPHGQKGWYVFDVESHDFFVSRDVIFQEDVFPFVQQKGLSLDTTTASVLPPTMVVDDDDFFSSIPVMMPPNRGSTSNTAIELAIEAAAKPVAVPELVSDTCTDRVIISTTDT